MFTPPPFLLRYLYAGGAWQLTIGPPRSILLQPEQTSHQDEKRISLAIEEFDWDSMTHRYAVVTKEKENHRLSTLIKLFAICTVTHFLMVFLRATHR